MALGPILAAGDAGAYRALGEGGEPVWRRAAQLRAAIDTRLGRRHAELFAVPQDQAGRVEWYAPFDGTARPYAALSDAEKHTLHAKVQELRPELERLVDRLDSPARSDGERAFGRLLRQALIAPGPEVLFSVDTRPVLVFWGFVREGSAGTLLGIAAAPAANLPSWSGSATTMAGQVPAPSPGATQGPAPAAGWTAVPGAAAPTAVGGPPTMMAPPVGSAAMPPPGAPPQAGWAAGAPPHGGPATMMPPPAGNGALPQGSPPQAGWAAAAPSPMGPQPVAAGPGSTAAAAYPPGVPPPAGWPPMAAPPASASAAPSASGGWWQGALIALGMLVLLAGTAVLVKPYLPKWMWDGTYPPTGSAGPASPVDDSGLRAEQARAESLRADLARLRAQFEAQRSQCRATDQRGTAPVTAPPAASNEDVIRRGGRIGRMNVVLTWQGEDDLDLHVRCPSGAIIRHDHRENCGGQLDVDANSPSRPLVQNPVENVVWDQPPTGEYRVLVKRYEDRSPASAGTPFVVELRVDGKVVRSATGDADGTARVVFTFEVPLPADGGVPSARKP